MVNNRRSFVITRDKKKNSNSYIDNKFGDPYIDNHHTFKKKYGSMRAWV